MTILGLKRYPVEAKSTEEFEQMLSALVAQMREAQGLLWADAARAMDDDPSYLVCSEWRTDGDLQAWEASLEATGFARDADRLLRGDVTQRRFTG